MGGRYQVDASSRMTTASGRFVPVLTASFTP